MGEIVGLFDSYVFFDELVVCVVNERDSKFESGNSLFVGDEVFDGLDFPFIGPVDVADD